MPTLDHSDGTGGISTCLIVRKVNICCCGTLRCHGLDQQPLSTDVILIAYREPVLILGKDDILRAAIVSS